MPKRIPLPTVLLVFLISVLFISSCKTLKRTTLSSGSTSKPRTASTPPPRKTNPTGPYNQHVKQVISEARRYTGTPYLTGGNDKRGIDCSGLIASVYNELGFKVPRISWQQSEFGRPVPCVEDIRPGDWLFFVPDAGKEGYVSHAGIVTEWRGKNDIIFIHASSSRGVREDNLFSTYFKNRFVKALRPF